jgi:hypothetical protein
MALSAHTWLIVRLLFVVYWTYGGLVVGLDKRPEFASMGPFPAVFAFVVGLVGARFFVFREYTRAGRTERWLLPSWRLNPFQIRQPFQFLHLVGVSFALFGVAALARALVSDSASLNVPIALFPAAFGAGILVGIRMATAAHGQRFVAAKESHA